MSDNAIEMNLKGLDQLKKALKLDNIPSIKIGILGSSPRSGKSKGLSNATVGAVHEFGAPGRGIPQRSFLRVPLADNLNKQLEGSGAFDEKTMSQVVRTGDVTLWMEKVAALAKGIVLEAFNSGGYGKWAPWKNPNYKNEGGQLLVDSQQLRNSIQTEIKK